MQQPDFTSLQTFVAVVEAGGFSRAAALLDSTTAAVSRRVAALEARLGTRLLHRTTRTMSLTEAGERYYRDLLEILHDLEEAEARAAGDGASARGTVRITAPVSFGGSRLGALLPGLMQRHPGLRVVLELDDRYRDLVAEGLDLALRIGDLKESSLVARRIAAVQRWICAAPDYLALHGRPRVPADLLDHACLHYNQVTLRDEWTLQGPDGPQTVPVSGPLCANNGDLLREAAIHGLGIAMLPDFIAAEAVAGGRLQRLLTDCEPPPQGLYAVWASRHFTPAKVRVVVEFLVEQFADGVLV